MARKIFLLDSGFNRSQKNIYSRVKNFDIIDNQVVPVDYDNDLVGHGTQIADIILKNKDIELNVIKIFDDKCSTDISLLILALEYINTQKSDVYLVHMSLGVKVYNNRLEKLCKTLANKGILLVAAFDNNKAVSYPAAFPFVIGVMASYRCLKATDFVYVKNSIVNIRAKGHSQTVVLLNGKKIRMNMGYSFAAAYVTAQILSIPVRQTFDQLLKHFEKNAIYTYNFPAIQKSYKDLPIKNAAAFPYNKEVHSLLKYSDKLSFNIVDFYDVKYSGKVGSQYTSFTGNKTYSIKNIETCDWDSFDTFILGHVRELGVLCNRNYKKYILDLCLQHKKHVYMFDDDEYEQYQNLFYQEGLILYHADIQKQATEKFGMLYHFKTPIVLCLGTSNKQGKFTLQLQIRYLMQEKGVKIGQIGTEPTSLLYDMDDMLITGYLGKDDVEPHHFLEFVNEKVNCLDVRDNQILFLGSQSAFLPVEFNNSEWVDVRQFLLLIGAMPDGVILSVNAWDSVEFISRCIQTIESMGKTKVFMLALYAFDMMTDYVVDTQKRKLSLEEINEVKRKFSQFNIPIIVSGDMSENETIFQTILNFFS